MHLCRALYGDAILVYHFDVPILPPEINKNIWRSLFQKRLFLFSRELAYVRMNISSNTWNGYYFWKSRGETFFQWDSIPILVSRTVKTRKFKLLYFQMKHATGMETGTKIYILYIFNPV